MTHPDAFYESLGSLGQVVGDPLPVTLSPELVGLLSDQLYRSPSKAIEELVVNGFDAEADEARVFVPDPGSDAQFIVVFDDGLGMTYDGLADLWKVGRPKVRDNSVFERKQRKQIGKFGIGKLATYAVANRVTYVTKTDKQHLAVTINYRDFVSRPNTNTTEVCLEVRKPESQSELWEQESFRSASTSIGLDPIELNSRRSWTIVILEDLKEKVQSLKLGRLRWVLRTAMPLSTTFKLYLNREEVTSSKEDYEVAAQFRISELPQSRLDALRKKTGDEWSARDDCLFATSFPSGISGDAMVTIQTLAGKSSELMRSEGFFVYVRGRLVNEEDARFGLHELSHATLNRFRGEISADDLDSILTANRESMEDVKLYHDAQAVLNEVFNEARQRYEDYLKSKESVALSQREDERDWVPKRLVEFPTADALKLYTEDFKGTEPDESWMYLNVNSDTDIETLTASLYTTDSQTGRYKYRFVSRGRADRLVEFDPVSSTFTINQDHELVVAYANDPGAQPLVQDIATSEAMLEVYLREAGIGPHLIGQILERRDLLLRGLANSHMFSLPALSAYVRDSANSKDDLEIAVVAGARALGFVAKHVSGSGEPDGVARFTDYPKGEQIITLEAKSSKGTPSAKDIDFSSIDNHVKAHKANGCLLVSTGYRGDDKGSAAKSARNHKISCWTVNQFADVIASAESRNISARQVLDVVTQSFSPQEVEKALREVLSDPTWESQDLYKAVVRALRDTRNMLQRSHRNVTMIATQIAQMDGFADIEETEVRRAISDIAGASHGGMLLRSNNVVLLNVDIEELDRRVQALTRQTGSPRRRGAFGKQA